MRAVLAAWATTAILTGRRASTPWIQARVGSAGLAPGWVPVYCDDHQA
jgi:hypothetical protein